MLNTHVFSIQCQLMALCSLRQTPRVQSLSVVFFYVANRSQCYFYLNAVDVNVVKFVQC
jgi:hypothetical protein